MVNLAWYKRLPSDLRLIFDEVAREAVAYSDELYSSGEGEIIERLGESVEVIRPTRAVRSLMRARTKEVYDFFVERGDYSWDDINAAISAAQSCGLE